MAEEAGCLGSSPAATAGLEATNYYDPPNLTFPFGTYICVVDINRGTGEVSMRRVVAVDDCGNIINPMIVQGQIHGGLTQGLGPALYEEIPYDEDGNNSGGVVHGLSGADGGGDASVGDRANRDAVAASPAGREGSGSRPRWGRRLRLRMRVVDALVHLGVTHMEIPIRPDWVWEVLRDKRWRGRGAALCRRSGLAIDKQLRGSAEGDPQP